MCPFLGQEIKFRAHPLAFTETSFSSSTGQNTRHIIAFSSLNPLAVKSRAFLAVLASPCRCVFLMNVIGPHLRFCEMLSFEDDVCCSRKNSSASWITHKEPCAQVVLGWCKGWGWPIPWVGKAEGVGVGGAEAGGSVCPSFLLQPGCVPLRTRNWCWWGPWASWAGCHVPQEVPGMWFVGSSSLDAWN